MVDIVRYARALGYHGCEMEIRITEKAARWTARLLRASDSYEIADATAADPPGAYNELLLKLRSRIDADAGRKEREAAALRGALVSDG